MTNNEKLLALYREYEALLRDAGQDYKQVEENAEGLLQDRMRLVRQTRNYLTHSNDPGFAGATDKQVAFLEGLIREQKLAGDILKKHLKTPKAASCSMDEKIGDALRKMAKLNVTVFPLTGPNEKLACTVGIHEMMKAYLDAERPKTAKLLAVKRKDRSVPCMGPMTPMPVVLGMDVPLVCCTDTGEMDGKFLGVWFRER
jgi:hypothetical protein